MESLRASFDKVDTKARAAIEAGKPDAVVASTIEKAWIDMFQQGLSAAALKGLVLHYRAIYRTRRTRKQRGGMAPLDWTMGQGTTAPVYGSFPVEMGATSQVVKALDNDRHYESSIGLDCDRTGIPPPPQKGGSMIDALFMGHLPSSVPQNVFYTGATAVMGAPTHNPAPAPEVRGWSYTTYTPQAFNPAEISNISTLGPVYKA